METTASTLLDGGRMKLVEILPKNNGFQSGFHGTLRAPAIHSRGSTRSYTNAAIDKNFVLFSYLDM